VIGEKRSWDIFTGSELALLTALGANLSSQLEHFDHREVLARTTGMQEALRRYVPGAVAKQLMQGGTLDAHERDVTVLFVDIRGYTAFSEARKAADIFSTINLYTEEVSRTVHENGGSVVEFNGDGMMAVFGAPDRLPAKERSAVLAARGIVEAVPRLWPAGEETQLDVGVGVASGAAFVGNISSVDRNIWSAIGNTTNLASRLQTLTKTLDCSIVVDDPTRRGAGEAAAEFEDLGLHVIRGRRREERLFGLRRSAQNPQDHKMIKSVLSQRFA
jgi:adenylate cyclase